jgi:hypothetical protein
MWTKRRIVSCLVALAAATAVGTPGCASDQDPSPCDAEPVDAFKELVVVDEDVLGDARAKNATGGPWSFRHAVEQMAPGDPSELVRLWLESWINQRELNSFPLDRPLESRAEAMTSKLLCPWYKLTPENGCDATCSVCKTKKLDLAKAPFRLIAITNRIDQRDEVATEQNGEGRLVFALTEGPADDAASQPLAMTVIFEYALPTTRSTREWADTWHALGKFQSTGEDYRAALESVTSSFTKRGSRPDGPNGSAIGQVRTNESTLNWIWQQREFGFGQDGLLHLQPTRNTPGEALNGTPQLATWLNDNRAALMKSRYEIPVSMRSGSSDALQYRWTVPGIDDATRLAFARGTCNGCHTTERPSVDTAFHVSPFRKGKLKLSPFLYDPNGGHDDITSRTASMRRALCSN